MAVYERSVNIAAPFAEVWDFHSSITGLEALTPGWMNLEVESVVGPDGDPDPGVLEAGSRAESAVQPFGVGPRQRWTSVITEREEGDGHQARPPVVDPLREQVDRDCGGRAEDRRSDRRHHVDGVRRGRPEADDEGRQRDELVEQAAEPGVTAGPPGELGVGVERRGRREVGDGVLDDASVVPRVVPAEVDLAALEHAVGV